MAYVNKLALNIEKTNFVLFHSPTWKFTDPIIIRFEREKSARKNLLKFTDPIIIRFEREKSARNNLLKFTDHIIIRFEKKKSAGKNLLKEFQVNFCGAWTPPPPPPRTDLFLTWHRDYLVSLTSTFSFSITMH